MVIRLTWQEPERWELMRKEWNTWAPLFLFNRQVILDIDVFIKVWGRKRNGGIREFTNVYNSNPAVSSQMAWNSPRESNSKCENTYFKYGS
jgi:hypothetical protein